MQDEEKTKEESGTPEIISEDNSQSSEDGSQPQQFTHSESLMFGMIQRLNPENNISDKLTEQHIDKFLDYSDKESERKHKTRHEGRIFAIVIAVIAIGAIFGLIALLKSEPDVMEKVITGILSFLGGIAAGLGIGHRKKDDDD